MKFYKTDSYEDAVQMAAKDIKKWSEEERRQLGSIASTELSKHLTTRGQFALYPENKRTTNLKSAEDCRSFVLEGEGYLFRNSADGVSIKKLLPSTLSQFSDEQLVNELCRRGWNYVVTEINYDIAENRKIKTSSLF